MSWRKVIRRMCRVPYCIHNDIVTKLDGDIVFKLDRELARFLFGLIYHDNAVNKYKILTYLSAFNNS